MTMRFAVTTFALFAVASTVLAADYSEQDILKPALMAARRVIVSHHVAPAILSVKTRGGAERFAEEWIYDHASKIVAGDIRAQYASINKERVDVPAIGFATADLSVFESGNSYDWAKFHETFPRAQAILVVSRPAVDSLGTTALVRFDVITPNDAWTTFDELEKQPLDGSWKVTKGAMGTLATFYRTDIHTHPPEQCLVPREKTPAPAAP